MTRPGPASGCATSPGWPASAARERPGAGRWNAAGAFSQVVLSAGQIMDPDSLLALRVNGADLTPDHGYPARVIVPASPGVHNTKWVASLTFRS